MGDRRTFLRVCPEIGCGLIASITKAYVGAGFKPVPTDEL